MKNKYILSLLFFISGFCGLLYQVVWLRLAMAEFGVVSPVISAVLSVFMLGLGVGAWLGGRLSNICRERFYISPILPYALCEVLIGLGGLLVPSILHLSARFMLSGSATNSGDFLFRSFLAILATLLPWTLAMGATLPLVMGFIREHWGESKGGFSFLYLANVIGAALGALATAFILIEINGFRGTLWLGAELNLLVALLSIGCWRLAKSRAEAVSLFEPPTFLENKQAPSGLLLFLFLSGFVSMGLEIVWNRMFAGRLGNSVYAFAIIIAVYLVATAAGTFAYRKAFASFRAIGFFRFFPFLAPLISLGVLCADPFPGWLILAILTTIVPLSFLFGALTPAAMDLYSLGDERRAGFAYAVNILGCILGPLAASYLLLPLVDEVWAIIVFSILLLPASLFLFRRYPVIVSVSAISMVLILGIRPFQASYSEATMGRPIAMFHDHMASVGVYGAGMEKEIVVNHVSMTILNTVTKMMVHFPLTLMDHKPESVLVICFGMGTTFRSALSWGLHAKVVELVPSVPAAFPFFHSDAEALRRSPMGQIVIDDGRRFLQRSQENFDLITLDPPPPIYAAASGMLYSVEFYEQAKRRLKADGLLQQWWYAPNDSWLFESALRSVVKVFPYVMIFPEGKMGIHIIASMKPIVIPNAKAALARMPAPAVRDMHEWEAQNTSPESMLTTLLMSGKRPWEISGFELEGPTITDDHPLNEYYFVRSGL